MSSFSSVVHKPGKKIVPKAAPRRNVQRRHAPVVPPETNTVAENAAETQQSDPIADIPGVEIESHRVDYTQEEISTQTLVEASVAVIRSQSGLEDQSLPQRIEVPTSVVPATSPRVDAPETQSDQSVPDNDSETVHQVPTTTPPAATASNIRTRTSREKRGQKRPAPSVELTTQAPLPNISVSASDPTLRQTDVEPHDDVSPSIDFSTQSNKRQRANRTAKINSSQSQNTPTAPRPSPIPPSPSVRSSSHSQPPTDLLQSATQRFASVSELANSIESHTRSIRPSLEADNVTNSLSEREVGGLETPSRRASQPKRKGRKKNLQEQAAEVVANAIGSGDPKSHNRALTPEDAANYELKPDSVKMGDLCRDSRLGKKSALETEMQANWPEILQRRKEDRERAVASAEKRQRKGLGREIGAEILEEPIAALAPAMTVVNGMIVVDQSSREIDRSAQLQQVIADNVNNIREDKDYYKYVNQGTVGMKPGRGAHMKWDTEATELFFKGLRMFGTDFLMISNMFPEATRKQIKTKFIREEKVDKARVLECLRNREPVQLEDYAHMANKETEEFQTLDSIQKELEEQEKQLREEDNQRRKREGFTTNEGGANDQSTAEDGPEEGTEGRTESIEPGRFDSIAREIVEAAVAPKKRQRKPNASNSKRGPKHGKRPEGGIEEVLGSINEVAV